MSQVIPQIKTVWVRRDGRDVAVVVLPAGTLVHVEGYPLVLDVDCPTRNYAPSALAGAEPSRVAPSGGDSSGHSMGGLWVGDQIQSKLDAYMRGVSHGLRVAQRALESIATIGAPPSE